MRHAFTQASVFGDQSLIASVIENARLNPERVIDIESLATGLRPEIASQIRRAVDVGQRLAANYPRLSASLPAGDAGNASFKALANAAPFPGGNPDIPVLSLSEYERNYSLDAMHADAAQALGLTGKGVIVATIDSGIDIRPDGTMHPELQGRIDPRTKSYLYWFDADRWDDIDFEFGDNVDIDDDDDDDDDGPDFSLSDADADALEVAFEQRPTDSMDRVDHGTHVAGIIGAGKNGFGMEGVAGQATLLAVKAIAQTGIVPELGVDISVFEKCGPAILRGGCEPLYDPSLGPVVEGFRYIAQFDDVKVINASIGPDEPAGSVTWDLGDSEKQEGVRILATSIRSNLDAGQIVVAAAGNDRLESPEASESPSGIGLYPFIRPANANATNVSGARVYDDHGLGLDLSMTSYEALEAAERADGKARGRIVVVVALDAYNELAEYSEECGVAARWCVAAPGGGLFDYGIPDGGGRGVYSTVPENDYDFMSGTSMATPNVSGALAVLIEAYPEFTPAELIQIMFTTAEDLGVPGLDPVYGWGLVRLDRALAGPVGMTGNGTYVVGASDSDTTWMFDFSSAGGFQKVGAGTLVIDGNSVFRQDTAVTGGSLAVDGALTAPMLTVGPAGRLGGTGSIVSDVTVAGNLSPGNSPGALTVTGDLTLTQTATTTIEIDGPGTGNGAGNYDRVVVEGSGVVFTAAGMLSPVLRGISGPATNSFVPALGQQFSFVDVADGSVVGSFAGLSQPDSGLPQGARFDVLYSPNSLALAATPASYADLSPFGVALNANEKAFGAALDGARPAAGIRPDVADNDLFNTLYSAGSADLANGFSSLTGQINAEIAATTLRAIGRFADTLGERQFALAASRLSPGDAAYGAGRVWIQGETATTNVGSSNGLAGYDARANRAAFGMDWGLAQGFLGFAGAYEYDKVSGGINGSGNVASYHGGVYGSFDLGALALAVRGGLTYADLSASRPASLGTYSSSAGSDGHGLGGFAEVSAYRLFEMPAVTLTPSATLGYRGFNRRAITETGSIFALTAPETSFSNTQTTLALAISRQFKAENGLVVEPVASIGWRHDFGDINGAGTLEVLDTPFVSAGPDIGRNALLVKLGVSALSGDRFSLGAGYKGEFRDNLASHVFSADLNVRF